MDNNDDQHNGGLEGQFEDLPENSGDVSLSAVSNDVKMASSSCSKRSQRIMKKRVVSVPIREFRTKGDHTSAPPSDSWAWRKYGQKPIKGSPYPRGYYRCSSSKVCPARKQVERSRVDPDMLMVTYSCEHNHPCPASKNNNQNHSNHSSNTSTAAAAATTTEANATTSVSGAEVEEEKKPINHLNPSEKNSEEKCTSLVEVPQIIVSHEFAWLNDLESTSCASFESSILRQDEISTDKEMGVAFTMEEEEESLFADLGELPECSTVFRHGLRQSVEEQRQHSLAPWCGGTW